MNQLILLHGALGSKDQFVELEKLLAGKFKVYSFNFTGHGGDESDKDFSIDLFKQNLHDYIITHNLQGCSIFGYSMGGYVALKHEIDYPGMIGNIITLGTKLKWDPVIAQKEASMLNPEIMETKIPKFVDALKKRHSPADWKSIVLRTADMMKHLGNGDAIPLNSFTQIKIPVTIALGSEDKMVSKEESVEIADQLTNGYFTVLENTSHPIEMVDPEKLSALINSSIELQIKK